MGLSPQGRQLNPSSSGGLVDLNRQSDPHGLYFEHDGSIQLNISRDIINSYRAGYMAVSDRAHQIISREDIEDGQAGDLLSAAVSNRLS